MENINSKDNYLSFLEGRTHQKEISPGIYRFTLPFLDRHNDQVEVYIKRNADDFTITDDGYTVADLELSGVNIFANEKRKRIYRQILQAHGISESENHELYVTGNVSELAIKKHMMAQCVQKIGDLFFTAQPTVKSLFLEDVQNFLDKKEIRYVANVSFIGKSNLPTNYDFAIPKSKVASQRIIKVVNNLTVEYTKSILFTWNDISLARNDDSVLFTFIHDTGKKVAQNAIAALRNYDIETVLWEEREKYSNKLSA